MFGGYRQIWDMRQWELNYWYNQALTLNQNTKNLADKYERKAKIK
jgi:hypothetical protein